MATPPACPSPGEKIPLVHVTSCKHLVTTPIPGSFPTSAMTGGKRTRDAEAALGLKPSVYFFAGRAHPDFGDSVFVYLPNSEAEKPGGATPFDTGAIAHGKCHPTKLCTDSTVRTAISRSLIKHHRYELTTWRRRFDVYLTQRYSTPLDYLNGVKPNAIATVSEGPVLPADDPNNRTDADVDYRAWTWEVQVERSWEWTEGLMFWATNVDNEAWLTVNAYQRLAGDPLVKLLNRHHPLVENPIPYSEEQIRKSLANETV
jgi:hypothetical protein